MDQFSNEQFLAIGAVGITIAIGMLLVILLVLAGSLKLCCSMIGNRTPTYLGCVGWTIAIGVINMTIASVGGTSLGPLGYLIAVPITWFATAYMLSVAGECSILRGFGIWIANGFVSTIGVGLVVLCACVPLAVIGGFSEEGLRAQMDGMDQTAGSSDATFEGEFEYPIQDATPVVFEAGDDVPQQFDPFFAPEPDDLPKSSSNDSQRPVVTPPVPQPRTPYKPKRANDGSTLNPFFK
ncbi:hypothetical protein [Roseiconus lacunae]|uniref:DUF805 domain-containing protein n=1 Tax=Roseiconus lacunae TaxID=2605694 RepID=A0ABT7PID7_9BACT|nr:hypothetical protein [Roseiconus lacunae]MCD0458358.1 hypothetical protein [Roseiconus lacunae]MDM4016248.1 hypothetical protein [Roseiconus lacunae]